MVGNVAFRSATFGGFNREDVMSYIEQSVRENKEALEQAYAETAAMKERAEELVRLNDELKKQLEKQQSSVKAQLMTLQSEIRQIVSERDSLKDKVDQMEVMDQKMEEMESRFQVLRRMSDQQREELIRYKTACNEKDQQIAELKAEVEQMRCDSESYHAMCDSIGQIEMDVRYRTTVMEQNAQKAYDQKVADAQASYDTILASAASDAEAVRQQVEERLEQMTKEVNSTAGGVNGAIAKALEEVGRVQNLLQQLNGCMNQYAGEVNQLIEEKEAASQKESGNE